MRVTCVSTELSQAEKKQLGRGFDKLDELNKGESYLVLGLRFEFGSALWGTAPWLQLDVNDSILIAPFCLFEVADPAISDHWEIQRWGDGSVTMAHPIFHRRYFHSDLARKDPLAVTDFLRIRALLAAEGDPNPPPAVA